MRTRCLMTAAVKILSLPYLLLALLCDVAALVSSIFWIENKSRYGDSIDHRKVELCEIYHFNVSITVRMAGRMFRRRVGGLERPQLGFEFTLLNRRFFLLDGF